MRPEYRRLTGLQSAITIIGAIAVYFVVSPLAAKSVVFGGSVVLLSTLFLAWRNLQASRKEDASAEWYLRHAYRTAIERFVWTTVMLVAGFKLLELAPLWMLAGFLGGQAAWLAVPIWMRVENVK